MKLAKQIDQLIQRSKTAKILFGVATLALLYVSIIALPTPDLFNQKADIFLDKELEALQGFPLDRPEAPPLESTLITEENSAPTN